MITDSLTGLYNRRYFDDVLQKTIHNNRLERVPSALIYIDIDNFKCFNDTYGHPKGDKVLEALGQVVIENIREKDHPCRIGGEEFAVIFPEANQTEAKVAAERIRKGFKVLDFSDIAPGIPRVTVSIGVTELGIRETSEEWIARTDQSLYQAKNEGKDRVIIGNSRDYSE